MKISTVTLALLWVCLSAAAEAQRQPPAGIQPMSINAEDVPYPYPVQYLELSLYGQDVRMAYMDVAATGTPNGRTVVLLHGMNWFGEYFGPVIDVLTREGFRVIAPDQVGFGRSSKPIIPYTLNDHAANTKAILDRLGIGSAAILGHSMGGMIATRFAFAYPETTSHLVIVNQIGLIDSRIGRPPRRLEEVYQTSLHRDYESIRTTFERYFVTWKPEYERYVNIQYAWTLSGDWPRLAMVRALNSQMIVQDPVVYDRPHIKAKTLFLSGAEDGPDFRKLAKWIVDTIPHAELHLIDHAGHNPFMEAPDEFFPPLVAFLKSAPLPATDAP
jgi:pimeloyl-ACP methyl ester carboxylesterase